MAKSFLAHRFHFLFTFFISFCLFVVHLSRLTDRCFCAHIHTQAHTFTNGSTRKGWAGQHAFFFGLSITLQLYDKRFSTILQVQVHNAFASLSRSQLAESVCVWIFCFCWFSFDSPTLLSLFVRETRTKMGKKKNRFLRRAPTTTVTAVALAIALLFGFSFFLFFFYFV